MSPNETVAEIAKQPHLINLISAEVVEQLDKRAQEREARHLRLLTVLTAIVLFVGYGGIKEMIGGAARDATDEALRKQVGQFQVTGLLANLQTAVTTADRDGSFTNTVRDQMMRSLERLAEARKTGVDVTSDPAFLPVLEKVVMVMSSSNNDMLADRAYELFGPECRGNDSIAETYLQHYGRHAAVGIGEVQRIAVARFGEFERTATTHKVPEVALVHRALIDFKAQNEQASVGTREVIQRVAALGESDRNRAWGFWNDYAQESWLQHSTGKSQAIRALTRAFLAAHRQELEPLFPNLNEVLQEKAP